MNRPEGEYRLPARSDMEQKDVDRAALGELSLSRRKFLEIGLSLGLAATVGTLVWRDRNALVGDENLFGKEIPGREPKIFFTDRYNGESLIPLHDKPNTGSTEFVTLPGEYFVGDPEYGVVYPSFPESLGKFEANGEYYGTWYKGVGLPLYVEKDDYLTPVLDELGIQKKSGTVHVSGNYLRLATDQEIIQIQGTASQ